MGPAMQKFITEASQIRERRGTSLPTRPIPSAIERHIAGLAPGDGVTGGSGNLHRAPMIKRKLMASMKKAQAMPRALMIHPTGAGAAMLVSCTVLWTTEN